jgi:hypothetical protein
MNNGRVFDCHSLCPNVIETISSVFSEAFNIPTFSMLRSLAVYFF